MLFGPLAVLGDPGQLLLELGRDLRSRVELVLGEQASLDALGDRDFLDRLQQRDPTDQLQIVLDRVSSRARGGDLRGGTVVLVAAEGPTGSLVVRWFFDGWCDRRLGHGPPVVVRHAGGTDPCAGARSGQFSLDAAEVAL
jgi:hypothetical protein